METFPFGNRIRQSQLIFYREMSNWARSIFIRYSSPAFAFSNWYVTPKPESIEVNVKTPPEVGSSHSKFLDLAELWSESPIQNWNLRCHSHTFFFYGYAHNAIAQKSPGILVGLFKASSCPKEADISLPVTPAAMANPAVALQTLSAWDVLERRGSLSVSGYNQ